VKREREQRKPWRAEGKKSKRRRGTGEKERDRDEGRACAKKRKSLKFEELYLKTTEE
jgi:hypothetical protein